MGHSADPTPSGNRDTAELPGAMPGLGRYLCVSLRRLLPIAVAVTSCLLSACGETGSAPGPEDLRPTPVLLTGQTGVRHDRLQRAYSRFAGTELCLEDTDGPPEIAWRTVSSLQNFEACIWSLGTGGMDMEAVGDLLEREGFGVRVIDQDLPDRDVLLSEAEAQRTSVHGLSPLFIRSAPTRSYRRLMASQLWRDFRSTRPKRYIGTGIIKPHSFAIESIWDSSGTELIEIRHSATLL